MSAAVDYYAMQDSQRLTELSLLVHQMHALLQLLNVEGITGKVGFPQTAAGAIDALDEIAAKAYQIAYPKAPASPDL